MKITFDCIECGSRNDVIAGFAGCDVRCTGCGRIIVAPCKTGPAESRLPGVLEEHREQKTRGRFVRCIVVSQGLVGSAGLIAPVLLFFGSGLGLGDIPKLLLGFLPNPFFWFPLMLLFIALAFLSCYVLVTLIGALLLHYGLRRGQIMTLISACALFLLSPILLLICSANPLGILTSIAVVVVFIVYPSLVLFAVGTDWR